MLFELFIVVVTGLGLLYWYLKDYANSGALKSVFVGNKIPMEREKFIPLLRNALIDALKRLLNDNVDDTAMLDALMDTLDLIMKLENRNMLAALIRDFEIFDPTYSKMQRAVFTAEQKRVAEKRFLKNFLAVMEKANFKMLSKQEMDFAEAEQYLLNIPVTSEWGLIDDTMMPNFFKEIEGGAPNNASDRCQQVAIWRRGIGIDQTTGLLLAEKIDVLLTRWFEAFAQKVVRTNLWQQLSGDPAPPPPVEPKPLGANEETVERISLKDMPLSWSFLTKPTTIQEPTFKEVVALFRYSSKAEKGDATIDAASIHIKTFRDIPLGDLDIIYPAKKILFKTVDFIRLGLTGVLGLYFALSQFSALFTDEEVDATMVTACVGLLALASRTYWNIQWSVDVYKTILSETLYNKSIDNHRGVLLFLIEALEAQELKEALIAYVFALKAGAPITESELDLKCEAFVQRELEATVDATQLHAAGVADAQAKPPQLPTVDFEVDDAVDKLARIGLATVKGSERGERIVHAVPLADALKNAKAYAKKFV